VQAQTIYDWVGDTVGGQLYTVAPYIDVESRAFLASVRNYARS